MDGDEKSRWPMVAAAVVVIVIAIGWYAKSRSAARDAAAREAAAAQGDEDRKGNTDWSKVEKDAARMEEKSRQRAERQRQQLLDKAKKE